MLASQGPLEEATVLTVYNLPDDFVRHGESCRRVYRRLGSGSARVVAGRISQCLAVSQWFGGAADAMLKKNPGTRSFGPGTGLCLRILILSLMEHIWPIIASVSQSCLCLCLSSKLPCIEWKLHLHNTLSLTQRLVVLKVNVPLCAEASPNPAAAGLQECAGAFSEPTMAFSSPAHPQFENWSPEDR